MVSDLDRGYSMFFTKNKGFLSLVKKDLFYIFKNTVSQVKFIPYSTSFKKKI